jgi:hypothetical protein
VNPEESCDPLLMSLVKSISINVDEGKETWIVYMCHSEGEWARFFFFSAFEQGMLVADKLSGLCQELQRCWGFHAQQFPMSINNGSPLNGHPTNLTQLWEALEST